MRDRDTHIIDRHNAQRHRLDRRERRTARSVRTLLSGIKAWAVTLSKGKATMKKIDVEKDYKRTKFLIVAMIVQIVVVFVCLFIYYAWLKS